MSDDSDDSDDELPESNMNILGQESSPGASIPDWEKAFNRYFEGRDSLGRDHSVISWWAVSSLVSALKFVLLFSVTRHLASSTMRHGARLPATICQSLHHRFPVSVCSHLRE